MGAEDERKSVRQAHAILRTLAAGSKADGDTIAVLREATRQITTAMARAVSGEAALNGIRADAATALSAVTGSLNARPLTAETIGGAERALATLLRGFDRQQQEPARIYVDPTLPATLRHDGEAHACHTLEEAVLAWLHLSEDERQQASIKIDVADGPVYTAAEIDRLHIGAEHQHE